MPFRQSSPARILSSSVQTLNPLLSSLVLSISAKSPLAWLYEIKTFIELTPAYRAYPLYRHHRVQLNKREAFCRFVRSLVTLMVNREESDKRAGQNLAVRFRKIRLVLPVAGRL